MQKEPNVLDARRGRDPAELVFHAPTGVAACGIVAGVRPVKLRCLGLESPLGVTEPFPLLTWEWPSEDAEFVPCGYRVLVGSEEEGTGENPGLWDTGCVTGLAPGGVRYDGAPLLSRQRVRWAVQVFDQEGRFSEWSETCAWEMGLLEKRDWRSNWISSHIVPTDKPEACPYFRKDFLLQNAPVRARLYCTANGLFEVEINGSRIGNDKFVPGWTNYYKSNQVLTYDVTESLVAGKNCVGAILGDGWYAGYLVYPGARNHYGGPPALLMQLEVEDTMGRRIILGTQPDWKFRQGPLLSSDLYDGEAYDARLSLERWSSPDFDDSGWQDSFLPPGHPEIELRGKPCPPVRVMAERVPISITPSGPSSFICDFGQNMAGWVRVKIRQGVGSRIVIRFAEMLEKDGSLYTANYRHAKSTDTYICRGGGEEVWEPRFTYHGFRYAEISGLGHELQPGDAVAVVLHTALDQTGEFCCSNPLLERLQQCIVWGQRGNYFEVPTDCPQRDERLGWTADAHIFARTACFNMDVRAFFDKWMIDMREAQTSDGGFPDIAPDVIKRVGAAGWADAGVICPWQIYVWYGHRRILEDNYEAMRGWILHQEKNSRGYIRPDQGFGDWLSPDASQPGNSPTPKDLIGTAYFARTTAIMAKVAGVLGLAADERYFHDLRSRVIAAFRRMFVTPAGRLAGDTQTAYLLALAFDLLPLKLRRPALDRLVGLIEQKDCHLACGFLGTPLLAPVLTRFGQSGLVYKLLLQESYPSWLYPILQGATTMWERWNSFTRESGFGDASMNSFNHYAYGAIGEWLYMSMAGINPDEDAPGFQRIIFRAVPDPSVEWVSASLQTDYGMVRSGWRHEGRKVEWEIEIPPASQGLVILPDRIQAARIVAADEGGTISGRDEMIAKPRFSCPAGRYRITYRMD